MSTATAQNKEIELEQSSELIRILVSTDNANEAEGIVQPLRQHGFDLEVIHCVSEDSLYENLTEGPVPDFLIFTQDSENIDPLYALDAVSATGVEVPSLIIYNKGQDTTSYEKLLVAGMGLKAIIQQGARDALIFAFMREYEIETTRKSLLSAQRLLAETEKRADELVRSSKLPIAYIREGVHLMVNPAYQELFGYASTSQLENLPVLDLVSEQDKGRFRVESKELFYFDGSDEDWAIEPKTIEIELNSIGSGAFHAKIDFMPTYLHGQKVMQISITDRTADMKLEAAISAMKDDQAPSTVTLKEVNQDLVIGDMAPVVEVESDGGITLEMSDEPIKTEPLKSDIDDNSIDFMPSSVPEKSAEPVSVIDSSKEAVKTIEKLIAEHAKSRANLGIHYVKFENADEVKEKCTESDLHIVINSVKGTIENYLNSDTDLVVHWNTTDFLVITADNDKLSSEGFPSSLIEKIKSEIFELQQFVSVRLAVGIALPCGSRITSDELIHNAKLAANIASTKSSYVHTFTFADAYSMKLKDVEDKGEEEQLTAFLTTAIDHDRVTVEYQPIGSLSGGGACGYASLARIIDENDQVMMPSRFIDKAGEYGLASEIDKAVLRKTIKEAMRTAINDSDLRAFVTLSEKTVNEPDFPIYLANLIKRTAISPEKLVLQISESTIRHHYRDVSKFIETMQQMNVGVAIDGLGEFENSEGILQALPVSFVKLHPSVIEVLSHADSDNPEYIRLQQLCSVASASGIQAIATKFENVDAVATFFMNNIHYVQGYAYSEPLERMNFDFDQN